MDSIDIQDVSSHTRCKISVKMSGTPEVQVPYCRPARMMQPDHLAVEYTLDRGQFPAAWKVVSVTVSGWRILNPGPNGEKRLGKQSHKKDWYSFSGDIQGLPDWVARLVTELAPTGDVTVPQ